MTVHGIGQAEAALRAAGPRGVTLLSAPGAAGFAGPAWFLEMVAQAARRHPGVPHLAALDCADAAGAALGALHAGARLVVLDGSCPAFAAVAAAAREAGADIWPGRPDSLDLGRLDLARRSDLARLRGWLAMEAPQESPTSPAS